MEYSPHAACIADVLGRELRVGPDNLEMAAIALNDVLPKLPSDEEDDKKAKKMKRFKKKDQDENSLRYISNHLKGRRDK